MVLPMIRSAYPLIALLLLISAGASAEKTSPSGQKKDSSWTEEVDSSLEFGAQSEQKAADQALSAVKGISKNIQLLKQDVVTLNKELRLMEEQLLFPSSTKFTFFVSMDTGMFFTLESIKLKVDGTMVASHLYSDMQRQAMTRGGIQKLHMTNINEGKHSITVFFTGLGPNGRPYKRAKNLDFEKGPGSGYIELAISDNAKLQEPVFEIKQW